MSKPAKHVKVVIRTRPTAEFAQDVITMSNDKTGIHIHVPKSLDDGYINNQQEDWSFKFDKVLHNASQELAYEECASPIMNSVLQGYNGTIMAYGQTGAGKTFTMTGATENFKHRGIIPRAISHLYREIAERPQLAFTVKISYLEVYNEQMIDLLSTLPASNASSNGPENLSVVEDKNGTPYVKNLTYVISNSEEDALNYLFEGETNRSISQHQLNKNSSRSHCIFTLHIESRSRVESSEKVLYSKLNLVDLAGSERLSKTETTGASLREAMYINKSLTFLEQVILALSDKKREHIPYRQSRMTHVLKDALGGNCNTLMIANIWGEKQHLEETISTLRFATRMMCVSNTPVLNVQFDPMALIKKYEREIRDLKQELSMHDTFSNRSQVQYEPYSENQRSELERVIRGYIENEADEIEIVNLRQIKELFNIFRIVYKSLDSEYKDLQKREHTMAQTDPRSPANERTSLTLLTQDNEKEDGVGDMEGVGFGVGIAPPDSKPVMSPVSKKDGINNIGVPKKGNVKKGKSGFIEDDEKGAEVVTKLEESAALDTLPVLQTRAISRTNINPGQPPSRAEEFEAFKSGKGAEMFRVLTDNKNILKDKKKTAKELAESVNAQKSSIDNLKEKIEKKKDLRVHHEPGESDSSIIDEEEFRYLTVLKETKQKYRDEFDALRLVRSDVDYCTRLVDQCRQKLMSEFEAYYEGMYGTPAQGVDATGTAIDDMLDIGEKFDKLQMERMSQEDPDSLPFYNAKKNMDRRNVKKRTGPIVTAKAK